MSRAINSRTYTSRPPANYRRARAAWDYFVKDEPRKPVKMWRAFMDYWVWVMLFDNGDYEEIDALVLRDH